MAIRKRYPLIAVFILLMIMPFSVYANLQCQTLFDKPPGLLKTYVREIKSNILGQDGNMRFTRLFLVDEASNPVRSSKGRISKLLPGFFIYEKIPAKAGFFDAIYRYIYYTVPHQLGYVLTLGQRNTRFAPFQWFDRNFIDKPTHAITQELFYKKLNLSFLGKLPLYFLIYGHAYQQIDTMYWHAIDTRIEHQIVQTVDHSPQVFENLIRNDYRYEVYKKNLLTNTGNINKQTLYDAAAFSRLMVEYYKLRDAVGEIPLEGQKKYFQSNPLFSGVKEFTEADIQPNSNYKIVSGQLGPLSLNQQDQIFKHRHSLLLNYQILDLVLFNEGALSYYQQKKNPVRAVEALLEDPFILSLLNLQNPQKAKYIMQKYLQQIYLLNVFNTMGIQYFMDTEHQILFTLETVRTELMKEALQQ